MAESIIATCITTLNGRLHSQETDHHIMRGAEDGIRSLISALESKRPFLKHADDHRGDDRHPTNPVKQLILASNDAQIVVDTYYLHQVKKSRINNGCSTLCVIGFSSLHRFLAQLKEVEKRVEDVVVPDILSSSSSSNVVEEDDDDEEVNEDNVVGLDDDIKAIAGELLSSREKRLYVVSVVGMGGLGKTTLARKVYEDMNVQNSFGRRAWVTASRQCDKRSLLLDLLNCLTGRKPDSQLLEDEVRNDDMLKQDISNSLRGNRYFLVLDNIWRIQDWEFLKDFLPDNNNGSRVLLTTRFQDIADSAGDYVRELGFLDEEQSLELLCTRAFPHLRGRCPTEAYERVGRKIANKCGGLPIQLVVLGGVLSKKKKIDDWNRVFEGVDCDLDLEVRTSKVLSLSYDDLPVQLKSCFLYLSAFPENYEISSGRLIRMWVAEGFVEEKNGLTVEEVAQGYLEALIKRSLVMVTKRNVDASVETCRVHDLLLDLSVSEAKHMRFLDVHAVKSQATEEHESTTRRIASHFVIEEGSRNLNLSPKICSFIHFGEWRYMFKGFMTMDSMLVGLNLLRVVDLDLGSSPEKIFLTTIGKMTLMTHLALDWGPSAIKFTSAIGNLRNLQTLDLRGGCPVYLPAEIWNLYKLRHLNGKQIYIDSQPRSNRCYDLQTLSGVRDPFIWNKTCSLSRLANLRQLVVSWTTNLRNEGPFSEALKVMKSLRSLKITIPARTDFVVEIMTDKMAHLLVFEEHNELIDMNLHGRIGDHRLPLPINGGFPPNLTKLFLSWAKLTKKSFAILEQLPKLKFLTISDGSYAEKELVCHVGGFVKLEYFEIDKIDEIEKWEVEEGSMPVLRSLIISYCGRLEKIPEGVKHIKNLKHLLLESMALSFIARVKKESGEDWANVQHIPNIIIRSSLNAQGLAAVGWGNQQHI